MTIEEIFKNKYMVIPIVIFKNDLGLVDLEHNPSAEDWAAMEQRNDWSGEAAVDRLVSILHNNESGPPTFPQATLGSSHWVPGVTVRPQR